MAGLAPALGAVATLTSTPSPSPTYAAPTVTRTDLPTGTITPTFTVSPTFTATPTGTPGSGVYAYVPLNDHGLAGPYGLVRGAESTMYINYTAKQAWPTGGELVFNFPAGFDPPTATNFVILPSWQYAVFAPVSYSGQTATVPLSGLLTGQTLTFVYGGTPSSGFVFSGLDRTITVQVLANPAAYGPATDLGALVTPEPLPIWTPANTLTPTPTYTVTPVYSPTPTVTPDFSHTATPSFTITPIGPDRGKFYSYPNPFDLRRASLCTFRFTRTTRASITIYNLLGQVVARVGQDSIFTQGFPVTDNYGNPIPSQMAPGAGATWSGRDDFGGLVSGGLYFAVLDTPEGKQSLKFTILH